MERREILLDLAEPLQKTLFERIVEVFLNATLIDGAFADSPKNVRLVFQLNKVFKEYENELKGVAKTVAKDTAKINVANWEYFKAVEEKPIKRLVKDRKAVESYTRGLLGLNSKLEVEGGGFLDDFIKDKTVAHQAKRLALSNITSNNTFDSFKSTMKDFLQGTERKEGAVERHFDTYLRDTYNQHDRITQWQYARRLGMKVFEYAGTIQKNSRNFCKDKTGWNEKTGRGRKTYDFKNPFGFWLIEESRTWERELKRLDNITKVGYDPLRDLGAWNCTHQIGFVGRTEAIRKRPDLEGKI